MENQESEAFDIFEKYGYIGVALFTCLSSFKPLKLTSENFLKSILDFYIKAIDKNTSESQHVIKKFIMCLPSLSDLDKILKSEILTKKELLPFKIILDLYEHFLKKNDAPQFYTLIGEYLPVALFFHSSVSDEEIKFLFDSLTGIAYRELYDLLVIKMKAICSKKRTVYIKHLNELKSTVVSLSAGLEKTKFCR